MKLRWLAGLGIAAVSILGTQAVEQGGGGDAYAPLRLYDGTWEVHIITPEKKTD